jgi:hypothetical protein
MYILVSIRLKRCSDVRGLMMVMSMEFDELEAARNKALIGAVRCGII